MITSGSPFIQLALTMNSTTGNPVRCLRDEQETTPPTVTTDSVRYGVLEGRASGYGTITMHGGAPIVQKGVCWGTGINPTLANNHVAASSSSAGHFAISITDLTEGVYHVRAYAKTAAGTVVYGNDVTLQYMKPNVVMDSVTSDPDDPNAFYAHVRVTSMGSDACVCVRAVVMWHVSHNPTFGNSLFAVDTVLCAAGSYTLHSRSLNVSSATIYVRPCVLNGAGITYGAERPFTPGACHGQTTMFDQDGNEYYTVGIGRQCWMKSNLATTHYADGTGISMGSISNPSTTIPYRYYPNNSSSNVLMYGYLYNWPAVMRGASYNNMNPSGVQGICPNGWHVPSVSEFEELLDYVSHKNSWLCSSSGYHLDTEGGNVDTVFHIAKAMASTSGWSSSSMECSPGNDQSTNNVSGFNAMPAGWYSAALHQMSEFHEAVWFWTCSYSNVIYNDIPMYRFYEMRRDKVSVELQYDPATYGMSVRCVRD